MKQQKLTGQSSIVGLIMMRTLSRRSCQRLIRWRRNSKPSRFAGSRLMRKSLPATRPACSALWLMIGCLEGKVQVLLFATGQEQVDGLFTQFFVPRDDRVLAGR